MRPKHRILRLLCDEGPLSRAEIGDRLGLPRTRVVADLERLTAGGLVQAAGSAASRGGRRSTLVEVHPDIRFAGIDLGVTSIDIEITDGRLKPIAAFGEAADVRSGPKNVLSRVNAIMAKLRAEGAYERLNGIGIGVPGPVSFRDGVPVSPPIMPGWDRYPVRELLAREHNCPVVVDNDVNIMAMGERCAGIARSAENVLFVKIGSGVGCGIFIGGELYRGPDGCAGDIGHIQVELDDPMCTCGHTGCLEALFSGIALERDATVAGRSGTSTALAERLATRGSVTAKDVAECAADGDTVATRLIRDGGGRLGSVLAGLVSFINPSMIVIGGGLAGLGHVLLGEVRSAVYRRSLPLATGNLPVVLSELGARAGVAGASFLASDLAFAEAAV
ncbi:ROK family transcriptional regulator [Sphaerisporangium aureirubrum]|uniref:ROK family protein n=1 Tax=Sphaerisporangium aureirubrum TaxID=1544736 RepID=A0ABW1NDU1_9ACTN